jgi:ferredoxin
MGRAERVLEPPDVPTVPSVLVVVCEEALGSTMNPASLGEAIAAACDRPVTLEIVADVCRRPYLLVGPIRRASADRVVVGLCRRRAQTEEYGSWAERCGVDPFAVELVDLGVGSFADDPDPGDEARLLASAVAKASALRPGQRGIPTAGRVGRRAALSGMTAVRRRVAAVSHPECSGVRRCGLCLDACPHGAVSAVGDGVAVDPAACTGCAACVTACPAGAMSVPGATLVQLEAQLEVLLAGPRPGIVLACETADLPDGVHRTPAESHERWLVLRVPCLSMVTPGWVLQIVASGGSVALRPHADGCAEAWGAPRRGRAAYCRSALRRCGVSDASRRVRMLTGSADEVLETLAAPRRGRRRLPGRVVLSEPTSTAIALLRIAGGRSGRIAHTASPLGTVRLDPARCTLCGACATSCPTSALGLEVDAERTLLSYEHALCLPCGRCVSACPETALVLLRETTLEALAAERVEMAGSAHARCVSCGRPIAPAATAARVREVLGLAIERPARCPACAVAHGIG